MIIRECLNLYGGNSGLTESLIYWNPPQTAKAAVTVYSGATLETSIMGIVDEGTMIEGRNIKIFVAPAIIVVRKGLAGRTKFIEKGKFTINDDAYVITVKEKYGDKINIEWLEKVVWNYAVGCVTSKGTNGKFSKEQFLKLEFFYPSMNEQKEIVSLSRLIDVWKEKLYELKNDIKKLDDYIVSANTVCKKEIKEVFDIKGGNSNLTEEFIYNNRPKGKKDAVNVFSSSTDMTTNMGFISGKCHDKRRKNKEICRAGNYYFKKWTGGESDVY